MAHQGKGSIVHTCTAEELFQTAMYHAFLHISIVIAIREAAASFFFYLIVKPTELAKQIVSIFFCRLIGRVEASRRMARALSRIR